MSTTLTSTKESTLSTTASAMHLAGQIANGAASHSLFTEYTSRKAENTVIAQHTDLVVYAEYLAAAGVPVPGCAGRAWADCLQSEPEHWAGTTWGLVQAFMHWQLEQGHAISTVNRRLSTIKTYCKLAAQAGQIEPQELVLIKAVSGYSTKEGKQIDKSRATVRVGEKKAEHTSLSADQVQALKGQPDTPQGRRDALLMALLLDHGLRAEEAELLEVINFDLKAGTLNFYRPKVSKQQTHKLTADTLKALYNWINSGDCAPFGPVLRGSRRGGALTEAGMSTRAITKRVRVLGEQMGIEGLSAHDCRHYWATYWAKQVEQGKISLLRLQEAGGWASLAMPRRYVEWAEIANEGMA